MTDSPVHTIEVDCLKCGGEYEQIFAVEPDPMKTPIIVTKTVTCLDCNKGKRYMAVWQTIDRNYGAVHGLPMPFKIWEKAAIKKSPYQSNKDLPIGETLEEVELKQVKDIPLIQMPKLWPPLEGEAWLCTALIREKV